MEHGEREKCCNEETVSSTKSLLCFSHRNFVGILESIQSTNESVLLKDLVSCISNQSRGLPHAWKKKRHFPFCLQHTGSVPYLKALGNGSVIYCIISDGKHSNCGVCPQFQQWEQLKGLQVTELHYGSTSFSQKILPATSVLTPGNGFPKEQLHCQKGHLLHEEGSHGI